MVLFIVYDTNIQSVFAIAENSTAVVPITLSRPKNPPSDKDLTKNDLDIFFSRVDHSLIPLGHLFRLTMSTSLTKSITPKT